MKRVLTLAMMLLTGTAIHAQPPVVNVPDLTGLNLPRAAAVLNAAGLQLGSNSGMIADGLPGTVAAQMPAPAAPVDKGSRVDVRIAALPNMRLVYDNNDFTLLNLGTQAFPLSDLQLAGTGTEFAGRRWGGSLGAGECVQVWSIRRSEPKSVEGCRSIGAWLTTTNPANHFWLKSPAGGTFLVRQGGEPRAECESAPVIETAPLVCEFYVETAQTQNVLAHLYIAYTPTVLLVRNNAEDGWMRLNMNILTSAGETITLNDAAAYDMADALLTTANNRGRLVLRELAPGQCVRFRSAAAESNGIPPCRVYAERVVQGEPFWMSDFIVKTRGGGKGTRCAAAASGQTTVCVVPRG